MALLGIDRTDLDDSTVLLGVKGYLDAFSVTEFRQAAADYKLVPKLIIKLDTTFLDSAGLSALVGAVRQVRDHRGEAAVVCRACEDCRRPAFHWLRSGRHPEPDGGPGPDRSGSPP